MALTYITAEMAKMQEQHLAKFTPGTPEFNAAMKEVSSEQFFNRPQAVARDTRSEYVANQQLADSKNIEAPDWGMAD